MPPGFAFVGLGDSLDDSPAKTEDYRKMIDESSVHLLFLSFILDEDAHLETRQCLLNCWFNMVGIGVNN
jgi:hypothetical protein